MPARINKDGTVTIEAKAHSVNQVQIILTNPVGNTCTMLPKEALLFAQDIIELAKKAGANDELLMPVIQEIYK